jgi:hypothetical protein
MGEYSSKAVSFYPICLEIKQSALFLMRAHNRLARSVTNQRAYTVQRSYKSWLLNIEINGYGEKLVRLFH